jgi:CheY-like chemotaxis protein
MRLMQVLMNLLSNAVKFTHSGEIYLGVRLKSAEETGTIELAFEVRDTGIGIPADKIELLFKSFSQVDSSTTRKYGGTGLGLVISEKLVLLMGGRISVASKPGEGTVFTFTIRAKPGMDPVRNYAVSNTGGMEGKRILVVDDNSTSLDILKLQLEQWKARPILVSSGKEALEVLRQTPGPDLVITDRHMPEMDGIELARTIRLQNQRLPIILLSPVGYESNNGLFFSVLTKPIRQEILCTHILSALGEQEGQGKSFAGKQKSAERMDDGFSQRYPMKILVVEDNLINQQLILQILNKLGYAPDCVENGKQAVAAAGSEQYDLILMDVQMPEMDGLETTRLIRRDLPVQPVIIALTANAMVGDREECAQAGMNDYISKPIRLEELMWLLEKYSAAGKA